MKNILGKRIELERNKLGINQIELAKKLNLSSSASISQYESGERTPGDDIKLKMCELFNCSLDYLIGRTDIRNSGERIDDILMSNLLKNIKLFHTMLNIVLIVVQNLLILITYLLMKINTTKGTVIWFNFVTICSITIRTGCFFIFITLFHFHLYHFLSNYNSFPIHLYIF